MKQDEYYQDKVVCDIISSIMQYITDPEAGEEDLLKHLRFMGCDDQIIDHVVHTVLSTTRK